MPQDGFEKLLHLTTSVKYVMCVLCFIWIDINTSEVKELNKRDKELDAHILFILLNIFLL